MAQRLPLPSERIYAPFKIAALVETLGEQGIPAEECLRGTGVDPNQDRLNHPELFAAITRATLRLELVVPEGKSAAERLTNVQNLNRWTF